ncbi:MAG: phosphatidylserine/phosphatidylglycerophosphate/cardiolipin synthase [Burkholderiaceae bacterium]
MNVHAVSKVRLDNDGRVTDVLWGPVDTQKNQWAAAEREAPVAAVVAALHAGDPVYALFPSAHGHQPDRRFMTVNYDNGWETIALDGPPTHEREVHDMDRL